MKKIVITLAAILVSTGLAAAQEYPTKPVRVVSPYAPGGSGDISARFIADGLGQMWGQSVTVENITGGGSMIGAGHAAQAAPDGYTILVHGTTFTMLPALRTDLPFDPGKDLKPVAMISDTQFVLVVGPSVKAKTIAEFVEEGKTREILATTSGPGTSTHFANELIAGATGMKMKSVHYKGGSEAVIDVVAGRADLYVATVTTAQAFLDSGQVRPLAVMGRSRLEAFPDVPTLAESGIDAEVGLWWATFVPAATPDDIATKLNADINKLMASPEGIDYLKKQQATHPDWTPVQFKEFFDTELAKWKKVAETQGITLN
ncbi:tripartite tricarboxylate transporter substrate binding protein [Chelativorans sp. AA-79]|uniref:Bug family tripartite tricarboxylate transporter substrate binding protein n=1 Tax=Chelativorans sp. AA-79 TaxID=3028735 RepID=UPI0023F96908|nr:tripartite tricarboxylate transporter substrate binding protein [Chelativorans sp. AA-79]WEX12464.1 tripartite tricarboxylate transporter substrate binding protein [Chelativorans sp. AA-79]